MTCCNKNCNQGRDCPARQACEMPIDVAEPDKTGLTTSCEPVGGPYSGSFSFSSFHLQPATSPAELFLET